MILTSTALRPHHKTCGQTPALRRWLRQSESDGARLVAAVRGGVYPAVIEGAAKMTQRGVRPAAGRVTNWRSEQSGERGLKDGWPVRCVRWSVLFVARADRIEAEGEMSCS